MARPLKLDPDSALPGGGPHARHCTGVYAEVAGAADHQPARAHRSDPVLDRCQLVERHRASAVAGSLYLPHALFAGRVARGAVRAEPGRHADDRSVERTADLRRTHLSLRGNPSAMWLGHVFGECPVSSDVALDTHSTADPYHDTINAKLATDGSSAARALFDRSRPSACASHTTEGRKTIRFRFASS